MRISDWSSDVCSSDLVGHVERAVDEDGDAVRLAPGLEVVELVGDRGAEHDRAMLVAVDHLAVEEGAGEEVERSREVRGETQFLRILGGAFVDDIVGPVAGGRNVGRWDEHKSELQT